MNKIENFNEGKEKICIIGLGYVGLPLAVLLNKKFNTIGFDINRSRIDELIDNFDRTKEITKEELSECSIEFTDNPDKIKECKVIIVTVPTPIDSHKQPDLSPIKSATTTVGQHMSRGSIIAYESTVYPGATEEECIPILEKESGLKWKQDFHVGYSPERVNPGDKEHTIDKIMKVVSGDTGESCNFLSDLYGAVITAGIHRAPTIKTAEAAKVIENTQRDLNIALMNELAIIFNTMDINAMDVIKAASTKWNFLKFEPGLVGGHCIGVDPYYLTFKAESIGYHPQIILAGRRINDNMGKYIAEVTVKKLISAGKAVKGSRVLILGMTFKENISDIRNTKVIDIYNELIEYSIDVYISDPHAYPEEIKHEYNVELTDNIEELKPYDAIIIAVKHKAFLEKYDFNTLKSLSDKDSCVIIDIKGLLDSEDARRNGFIYWSF